MLCVCHGMFDRSDDEQNSIVVYGRNVVACVICVVWSIRLIGTVQLYVRNGILYARCSLWMDSSSSCPIFNVEEEVVVIRNGWTPRKEGRIHCLYIVYSLSIRCQYIVYTLLCCR